MRVAHMQKSSEQKTVHRPLVQGALVFRMATFLLARTVLRLLDGWTSRTQWQPSGRGRFHGASARDRKGPAWPGLRSIPLRGPPRRSDREQRLPTNQTRLRLRARNKSCRRSIELAAVPRRSLSGDGSLSVSTAVTANGVVLERRCNGSKQLAVRRQSSGAPRQGRDGSF